MVKKKAFILTISLIFGVVLAFFLLGTSAKSKAEEDDLSVTIDQLRTFYDDEGVPFKVLVQPEILYGNIVAGVYILDSLNNTLQKLDVCSKPPYNYYDGFLGLSYIDVTGDGVRDIIIEGLFSTGIGANGAKPTQRCIVYKDVSGSFQLDYNISRNIPSEGEKGSYIFE